MNISAIKTPGVYVNEIDAFPPSIAQVATAIPAFVGYTEKATSLNVPTRISSLMEYEQIFGGAPVAANITVDLDSNLIPLDTSSVTESNFKLYNSMRLFYANGGGECYIVSIGIYTDNPSFDATTKGKFTDGIDKLEKYDEPTLILFPDAVNLSAANLGAVQVHSLMQCQKLMDRFTIMDVKQTANLIDDSEDFRDEIGNQNLKYGAAYYPYLQANFPYQFRFNDINGIGSGKVNFASIYATDLLISPLLNNFDVTYKKVYQSTAPEGFDTQWDNLDKSNYSINILDDTQDYVDQLWSYLKILGQTSSLASPFKGYVETLISISLKQYAQKIVDFSAAYGELQTPGADPEVDPPVDLDNLDLNPEADFDDVIWKSVSFTASGTNPYSGTALSTSGFADQGKIQAALDKLNSQIIAAMNSAMSALENYVMEEENNLISNIPLFSIIVSKLSQSMNTVPPSGAIAGIYAQTDATKGVWKAPANVSVNSIIGLTDDINDKDQENMNIHETGKSINAIRKFTGRGNLVWGARTLAGNSNDWRYVNVRRLANMIEESVKKACMQFVFEPNVAQTWVNVKGMIENYLTTLWNDGALAGAKPEHAFFVAVGLNQTMSAQDILEGRMIVKIGYAPSRPAEFIILEFKQMQQKS
ncbi:phage tail sheath subtilisin-like domain-containing protein [Chryseobacterium sp. C-71]|uniref:phage tail sheath C-terminal domain-containing protein n=1 Tax=Chryseobacterium sp. C-71 TaxID=2893882 RepID=UPI001E2900A3|nr:phage tail sheath C-terminal domain-containing protein [Chryseobacterium sp. C-71]UFH33165.1 phage tail sheath subtilisin-like domain-containing protein [Chryseobacterium sp. C-71]